MTVRVKGRATRSGKEWKKAVFSLQRDQQSDLVRLLPSHQVPESSVLLRERRRTAGEWGSLGRSDSSPRTREGMRAWKTRKRYLLLDTTSPRELGSQPRCRRSFRSFPPCTCSSYGSEAGKDEASCSELARGS